MGALQPAIQFNSIPVKLINCYYHITYPFGLNEYYYYYHYYYYCRCHDHGLVDVSELDLG